MEKEIDILRRQVEDLQAEILTLKKKQHSSEQVRRSHIACEQAALDLQEEMKFRESFIRSLPGFFVAINSKGKTVLINDLMLQALGYTRDEVVGRDYLATLVPETEREKVSRVFQELIHKNEATISENHIIAKDGKELLMEWQGRCVFNKNGKVDCFYGVGKNITEHKRMEDALRVSEEIFNSFMEHCPVYVFFKDETTRPIRLSRNYEKMLGRPMEDILGKTMDQLFPSELSKKMVEDDLSVIRNGKPIEVVEELNGRIFETTKFPIVQPGKSSLLAGFTVDITDRRRTEEALLQSEDLYRGIFENASVGITRVSLDGIYREVNPAMTRILGYSTAELTGRPVADFTHPDDLERRAQFLSDLIEGRIVSGEQERRFLHRNGSVIWTLITASVRHNQSGKPLYFVSMVQDITERKRAEEALRESERFLRSTLDGLSANIALLDEQGKILHVNKAWGEFAEKNGISSVSAVSEGSNYLQICDSACGESSEEAGPFAKGIRDVLSGVKESFVREYPCHSPDKKRWFVGRITPFPGDGPRRVIVAHEDITERKQAEEALRSSQQIIEGIINAIPVRVFWKDMNLVYQGCNEAFARDAGFTDAKDIIGKNDYQMGWREQAELYRSDDRQVIESGKPKLLIEEPQTTPEGNSITLLTNKLPLRSPNGDINGVLGTYMDITERKRMEDSLRESEERYRILVEISTDALLWQSSEAKIVYANPSAAALFHAAKAEDLLGKNYLDLVHPDDFEESVSRGDRCRTNNTPLPWREHRLIGMDGQVIHVESTGFPINYQGQQHMVGLIRDLTERKRLEEEHKKMEAQIRQAQKMEAVGRLAGGVAHDFNNMLGVILGFSELAIAKLPADDSVQEYLSEVKLAAQRSADITRQLLAFARRQTISPKVLDLNDTIEAMLKMLRRLIGEDIDLEWKPAQNIWPVKMDPSQIDQILANLTVNARDAISGVGKITIETENNEFDDKYCESHRGFIPGKYSMLAVSDNGCGMDKETLGKLFEPFFTTKKSGEGTGLGLATVYGIVKQNNGFINVYSEPGHGTTFKIYLPRQDAETEDVEHLGGHPEATTGTETVLLVEDEQSLLKFSKIQMEDLGYRVLAASSPQESIQISRGYAGEIHLLMTDVVMPEMNGRDLCAKIEELRPGIKCLFMSGYTANVIAHHGVLDEGVHFLQKPFSREALARKLREALA